MTNSVAIGYMRMAARALHVDSDIANQMERYMTRFIDFYDEEAAQKAYQENMSYEEGDNDDWYFLGFGY